jgi:hypothetical protein
MIEDFRMYLGNKLWLVIERDNLRIIETNAQAVEVKELTSVPRGAVGLSEMLKEAQN